jgi:uncharacterized phage protein (TIGR01671 family)
MLNNRIIISQFGVKGIHGGEGYVESWELSQYTGLKDKNGVEIYEGDIVKYLTTAVARLDGMVWTGRVIYAGGAYRLYEMGSDYFRSDMTYPYEYEVIGNIYKNPELLEIEK